MESWGEVLWDRHGQVLAEVAQSRIDLERYYGEFFEQRSRVEDEYARNIKIHISFLSGKQFYIRFQI